MTPSKVPRTAIHVFSRAVVGFVIGAFVYVFLLIVYWQVFPYRTADVGEPMLVLNEDKEIKRGEMLKIELTFTKYTNVTPEVSRNVFCLDDSVHFPQSQPVTGTARPVGTFTARPVYDLPDTVPSDVLCFFQFTNEYEVNPIRTITKVWRSESFIVRD